MKKIISLILVITLIAAHASSQVSIASTNGYNVNITVTPKAIVPTSNSCQWGYNYNVRMNYSVTFTGTNIPSSLYTLQGTLGCGSSSHFFDLPNGEGNGSVLSQSNVWNPNSDCGTATVSSLNCNTVNIEIQGPGISRRTVSFSVSAAPLPITLIDFNAIPGRTAVNLDWSTATETGNSYFSIERSVDGVTWETIGTVNGAGNSSDKKNYSFIDKSPLAGTSYYRLKQTDIDQHYSYTDVRKIFFTENSQAVSVYPVPNNGNTIFFNGLLNPAQHKITFYNASGTEVFHAQLSTASITVPGLKAGFYIIRLTDDATGNTTSLRYIQQ